MATIAISNKLCAPNDRDFLLSRDNWARLEEYPFGDYTPNNMNPGETLLFKIEGKRIHDSSIAVSLRGFTHTVELVDKCLGLENFVLLRFVPKPIGDVNTPDIMVECLPIRPIPNYNDGGGEPLNVKLLPCRFKYLRKTILTKANPQGVIFEANYSFKCQGVPILIGDLDGTETLEMNYNCPRPSKNPFYYINSRETILPYTIKFIDHNNTTDPFIELQIQAFAGGPDTINITIDGDET